MHVAYLKDNYGILRISSLNFVIKDDIKVVTVPTNTKRYDAQLKYAMY